MEIISLFSGCGGLDLGFSKAGFKIIWANEKDSTIWETYENNHPHTFLDKRSIVKIPSSEIPNGVVGVIGGPPCQSWSYAGKGKGISDPRGQLFYEFIRVLEDKQPLFFLAENVAGMLSKKHSVALRNIIEAFNEAGYNLTYKLVNASDYDVPQNRKRVFFVGYRKDLNKKFVFPLPSQSKLTVKDAISDIAVDALPARFPNITNGITCGLPNHEYWLGGFSYIYMSRNRVLDWNKSSFTIQASGRHVSLHPQSPEMIKVKKDIRVFAEDKENKCRRLTIRECARCQTFPDDFIFYYNSLNNGYKMVGNAVPVNFGIAFAKRIFSDLEDLMKTNIEIECVPNINLRPLRSVQA